MLRFVVVVMVGMMVTYKIALIMYKHCDSDQSLKDKVRIAVRSDLSDRSWACVDIVERHDGDVAVGDDPELEALAGLRRVSVVVRL